ncbi:FAD-binding protein, partial [Streptomyces sp. SID10244]|nr:FAD-binding protein [Streptomyces sp. SID10244]
ATGAQVQRALERRLRAASRSLAITGHDDAVATAILRADGQTVGVAYRQRGRERVVHAPTVLLATGGSGHLYAATTNPSGATADGIALALRAGAVVADMEFIQFHPTMLFVEGARGRRTLISEAVRGEGGRLVDVDGDPVTAGVHPMGDLAPRDVVA